MASNNPPRHFWQILYPGDIEKGSLRLSPEFVAEYGYLLSDEAVLELPDGKEWKIRLAKELGFPDERVWLKDGFSRFLEYYSVEVRYLLLLQFRGSSRFGVFVFDLTACEIVYPISGSMRKPPVPAGKNGGSDASGSRRGGPPKSVSPLEPQPFVVLEASDSDSEFDFDHPDFRHLGKRSVSAGKNGGGTASGSRQRRRGPPKAVSPLERQNFVDLVGSDSDSDSDSEFVPDFTQRGKPAVAAAGKNGSSSSDFDPGSDSDDADFRGRRKGNASTSRQQQQQRRRPPIAAGASSFTEELWNRVKESTIVKTKGFHERLSKLSEASQVAIWRAVESNPKNRSFLVVIKGFNTMKGIMHFPIEITENSGMRDDLRKIKLRVYGETDDRSPVVVEERVVKLSGRKRCGSKMICEGRSFCKYHNLVEGDVCLFELVDPRTNLFDVRKFHVPRRG
ncbi:B3 domain-containing transcription factor VRN1 [Linum grandiflorum]